MNKRAFIDSLNGMPVAKDMFGRAMHIGDWIVWGGGQSQGSGVNFGKITKINYSKDDWRTRKNEKVTSVTCIRIEKPHEWDLKNYDKSAIIDGYVKAKRKQPVQNFASAWVIDEPPELVKKLIEESNITAEHSAHTLTQQELENE